jgi:hypothetical protein
LFYVCVVILCVCTFLIPCCDVRYDFSIKTMFCSSLPPVVAHVLFTLFFVCWRLVASNTYCLVFLFYFSSSCVLYADSVSVFSILDSSFGLFNVYLHSPMFFLYHFFFLYAMSKTFGLFRFQNIFLTFWILAYLMNVIPERRREHYIWCQRFNYYHWIGTTAGELSVPEGIVYSGVNAAELTWFIRYILFIEIYRFEVKRLLWKQRFSSNGRPWTILAIVFRW